MSQITIEEAPDAADGPAGNPPRRRRITLGRVLIALALVVVLLVGAGVAWWIFGRDHAEPVSTDSVVKDFRDSGSTGAPSGGPPVGVYAAVATGTEDVGFPGLTESLGPNAPVTVTAGDGGCFTYRVDFNTHHWRNWQFCPTDGAAFALARTQSYTTRNLPGVDFGSSLNTYVCDTPVPYLWTGAQVGDRRQGSCTGTSDTISGVTTDTGVAEVLGLTTVTVGGTDVDVVHIRVTDTFGQAQSGHETDEWFLDSSTGLPVKIVIESDITSDTPVGTADYVEKATLDLATLVPAT